MHGRAFSLLTSIPNIFLLPNKPACLISVLPTPSYGKLAKNKHQGVSAKDRAQWGSVLLTLNKFDEQEHLNLRVELIYHFARNRTGELPTVSESGQTVQKPIIISSEWDTEINARA